MECEACKKDKGSAWPWFLDFSAQHCAWCNSTKEVAPEVAAVFQRLSSNRGLLGTRASTLMSLAVEARNAWNNLRNKKRPKGHSEVEWVASLKRTEQAVSETASEAQKAWELAHPEIDFCAVSHIQENHGSKRIA